MIKLDVTKEKGRTYFLEITSLDVYKLVYIEKIKDKKTGLAEDRKTVVGEYGNLLGFLNNAKFRVADTKFATDMNELALILIDAQEQISKNVLDAIVKDKELYDKVLESFKRRG